jgi:class 3 adenylate cyclase
MDRISNYTKTTNTSAVTSKRQGFTATESQVSIADRLESICDPANVLIRHSTWGLVNDDIECSPRDKVKVKGIDREIMTYDVVIG